MPYFMTETFARFSPRPSEHGRIEAHMATEKQLAALKPTQWVKGQSGNPGGRKKRLITEAYLDQLEAVVPEIERTALRLPKGARWFHAIARARIKAACRGTVSGTIAAKEIADRTEGRSIQRVELAGESDVQVVVKFEPPPRTITSQKLDLSRVVENPEQCQLIEAAANSAKPLELPNNEAQKALDEPNDDSGATDPEHF